MTRYRTTRAPHCVDPRPHTDASQRLHTYGPVQPLDEDISPAGFVKGVASLILLVIVGTLAVVAVS